MLTLYYFLFLAVSSSIGLPSIENAVDNALKTEESVHFYDVNDTSLIEDDEERILGGQPASLSSFPWMVSLQTKPPYEKFCGGSIIDTKWILTAGHCVLYIKNKLGSEAYARAGIISAYDSGPNHQLRKVKAPFYIHPNYQGGQTPHDIALLKLETPFTFSQYIQRIEIPPSNFAVQRRGKLMGFGVVGVKGLPNLQLNYVEVGMATLKWCQQNKRGVTDHHICPGENGKTACKGDSGGPFVQTVNNLAYVVGVNSFGNPPCSKTAHVYVLVPKYVDSFIKPTMEKN